MKQSKRLVIFGATGKVGRLTVQYALADGYTVTAFVHRHHDLPQDPHLRIVHGDIHQRRDIEKATKDADVILSALGSWGTAKKDILASAMANIIPVMQQHCILRIVSLTGAEARATGDKLSLVHRLSHLALGIIAAKVLHDGEKHIQLLEGSGLEWLVIRSPIMTSGDDESYQLSSDRPLPWQTIDRRAVARALVDQASSDLRERALYIQ